MIDVKKRGRWGKSVFKDDLQISDLATRIAAATGTTLADLWPLATARQKNSSGSSAPAETSKDDRKSSGWCSGPAWMEKGNQEV